MRAVRHLRHVTWTSDAGMPLAQPNMMYQSDDGYLWFASVDGPAVRFDGTRFTKIDSTIAPAMMRTRTDYVFPIGTEHDGALWLARGDGALFRYRGGHFQEVVAADRRRGRAAFMVQSGDEQIWIAAGDRLYRYRERRLDLARLPNSAPNTSIAGVVVDTGSGIWVSTNRDGIWHVHGDSAEHFPLPNGRHALSRALIQSMDGRVWVWSASRLWTIDDARWKETVLGDRQPLVNPAAAETLDGEVWIGLAGTGVARVADGRTESFSKRDGLTDGSVRAVAVDRENNVWVLTDVGLDEFNVRPFITFGANDRPPFDSPRFLVGDEARGAWTTFAESPGVYHVITGIAGRDTGLTQWRAAPGTDPRGVTLLAAARGGGVWATGSDHSITRIRDEGSTPATPAGLIGGPVRAIQEDHDGSLLIAFFARDTTPGVARWRGNRLTPIRLDRGRIPGSASLLVPDGRGRVWANDIWRSAVYAIAGDSVVARLDSASGVTGVVVAMAATGGDTVWMATVHDLLRATNGKVVRVPFDGDEQLLSRRFVDLVAAHGALWVGTAAGIVKLPIDSANAVADGRTQRVTARAYSAIDGITVGRTPLQQPTAAFRDANDHVWFSTPAGIAVYDPSADIVNRVPLALAVERVTAAHRVFASDSARIPPSPDRVDIEYAAIGLRSPARARVEYTLEGADQTWHTGSPSRIAAYNALRPGLYRFRVRGWNEDGVASPSEASLVFTVLPAWYQTASFTTLLVLALAGSGPLIVYRVQQTRARRRERELHTRFDAMLGERTRVAGELHDTLLSGFTGVTLQLSAIQQMVRESPDLADRVSAMMTDAEQSLIEARQMIWDMRVPELLERELPEAVEAASRRVTLGAEIDLTFVLSGERRRLAPRVESTVLRVAREAVTNAVRHAQPHHIEVELAYEPARIVLGVHDDGAGVDTETLNNALLRGHWGVRGMRERAARIGGTLRITTSTARPGTSLELALPTDDGSSVVASSLEDDANGNPSARAPLDR